MTGERRQWREAASASAASAREARAFSRYLVGRPCSEAEAARYAAATARLMPSHALTPSELNVIGTAARFPRLAGPLDAAAALVSPRHPLRARLLIMSAILEASPAGARDFLPAPPSRPFPLLLRSGLLLASAGLKAVAGMVLLPLARTRCLTS